MYAPVTSCMSRTRMHAWSIFSKSIIWSFAELSIYYVASHVVVVVRSKLVLVPVVQRLYIVATAIWLACAMRTICIFYWTQPNFLGGRFYCLLAPCLEYMLDTRMHAAKLVQPGIHADSQLALSNHHRFCSRCPVDLPGVRRSVDIYLQQHTHRPGHDGRFSQQESTKF